MREEPIRCKCGKLLGYKAERTVIAAGFIKLECRHCRQATYVGTPPAETKPKAA